jgi:hypothetical protein
LHRVKREREREEEEGVSNRSQSSPINRRSHPFIQGLLFHQRIDLYVLHGSLRGISH